MAQNNCDREWSRDHIFIQTGIRVGNIDVISDSQKSRNGPFFGKVKIGHFWDFRKLEIT